MFESAPSSGCRRAAASEGHCRAPSARRRCWGPARRARVSGYSTGGRATQDSLALTSTRLVVCQSGAKQNAGYAKYALAIET